MHFFKVFLLLLISIFCSMAYGHGISHVFIHHKHRGKFGYHIKHGKHGSHRGSSYPHGYGGYGGGQ